MVWLNSKPNSLVVGEDLKAKCISVILVLWIRQTTCVIITRPSTLFILMHVSIFIFLQCNQKWKKTTSHGLCMKVVKWWIIVFFKGGLWSQEMVVAILEILIKTSDYSRSVFFVFSAANSRWFVFAVVVNAYASIGSTTVCLGH